MRVNDPNIIVCSSGLLSVEIKEESIIKITLKNRNTLTLKPIIDENNNIYYEMDFLTKKENKEIERYERKIQEFKEKINSVKKPTTKDTETAEYIENIENVKDIEEVEDVEETSTFEYPTYGHDL